MLWADTGSTCRSLRGITYQVSALRPLLEALRGLRKLSLADVGLETLPLYVGQLQPLEELSLMGVKGLGDPTVQAAVAGLSNLRKLRMQWCSEDSSGKQAYNLPTSFLGLTQMQSLDFSYTDITSNTVELLPLFKQLKEVNLMYCHLPATLLVNTIQQLTGLTSLDLSCTRISSLPEQITSFTNLRKLSWSYLEPSTYPQEPSTTPLQLDTVWRLKSLRYLHITDNTITCLPAGLGQLTGLTCLLCCAHLLVDPPGILSCLVNLEELYLFFSSLPTLPESLTTLTRLTRVHVPQTAPMVVPPVVQAFLDARQTC
jgi:Leucine-rich repeat (LRR) protein